MKSPALTRCYRELHSIRQQLTALELSLQSIGRPEGFPVKTLNDTHTIDAIKHIIATHFGLSVRDLSSKRRTDRLAWPRHIAMALSYEHTQRANANEVGAQFNRHHDSVRHACKVLSNRLSTEPATKAILDIINAQIAAALQ